MASSTTTLFAVCLMAVLAVGAMAYDTEESVIVGTDDNLPEIIKENEFVLVEFYAPWCGHCQHLAPEYASAAKTLEKDGSPIKLVKVDATQHSKSAEEYEVQGYPTLKWFKNGRASEYQGGRTDKEILQWVNKKSGPPAVTVDDVAAMKKLVDANDIVVLGVFNSMESEEAKAFEAAADTSDNVFAITTKEEVAKEYSIAAPKVILLKNFDEGRNDFDGKFNAEELSSFVVANQLPLVIEFSDETAQKIFGGEIKKHMLLFLKKSDSSFEDLKKAMSETATEYKGQILFVLVDGDVEDHGRIMEFFGLTGDDLPSVRIIDLATDMTKFKPETTEVTAENLKAFAKGVLDGKIKAHLKSEPTPEDWDAQPVKVLTGENFADVALNQDKHVLVEFYAPWCGHCKQLTPVWDKLGAAFEGTDNVVIAKIDATANEMENVNIKSFPTIKLFPAGSDEAVDYDGNRDLDAFVEFMNEKAGTSVKAAGGDDDDADAGHEEL